jgi:hypothetical protein
MDTKMAPPLGSAWTIFCVVALAILAWTPVQFMVRTGVLSGHEEHFLAYALTALSISMGQRRTTKPTWICLGLVVYASILELGQTYVPGRHPAMGDFYASALGALTGAAIVLPLCHVLARALSLTSVRAV